MKTFMRAPCVSMMAFCRKIDAPTALISGPSRVAPRVYSGR